MSAVEDKIKLLMVMCGYNRHDIKFRGKDNRHIMYGYWGLIDIKDLEYVSEHANVSFEIDELEDSDCGWLYSYNIRKQDEYSKKNKEL